MSRDRVHGVDHGVDHGVRAGADKRKAEERRLARLAVAGDQTAATQLHRLRARRGDTLATLVGQPVDASGWQRWCHWLDHVWGSFGPGERETCRETVASELGCYPDRLRKAPLHWLWPEIREQVQFARTIELEADQEAGQGPHGDSTGSRVDFEELILRRLPESRHLSTITGLDCGAGSLPAETWRRIVAEPRLRHLEQLRIHVDPGEAREEHSQLCRAIGVSRLELDELGLVDIWMGSADATDVFNSRLMSRLTRFELYREVRRGMGDRPIKRGRWQTLSPTIRHLRLRNSYSLADVPTILRRCGRLTELELLGSCYRESEVDLADALQLRRLRLTDQVVLSEGSVAGLRDGLEHLDLSAQGRRFDAEAERAWAEGWIRTLPTFTRLRSLSLAARDLGTADPRELAEVLTGLGSIDLDLRGANLPAGFWAHMPSSKTLG